MRGITMLEDLDPAETREWLEALDSVLAYEGADRAFFLLDEVVTEARRKGAPVPYSATTPHLNTIPPDSPDRLSPREQATVADAITRYGVDPDKPDPSRA
jgi:pyruvate dehydrogenase complex dehydrogenase (E1) component